MDTAGLSNPMLGSQLVGKSIILAQQQYGFVLKEANVSGEADQRPQNGDQAAKNNKSSESNCRVVICEQQSDPKSTTTKRQIQETNNNKQLKSLLCQPQEAQVQQVEHHLHETANNSSSSSNSKEEANLNPKDFELLARETQELKIKIRKLQLEIEEKNEIINVLKDELETTKDQNDIFQRENLQLLKDSKRVKFLQDENDFLQDKVGNTDKLELEIKRLKEKLNELDFLKLRIGELEEDRTRAQDECSQFEDKFKLAEAKLIRVSELESELNKWKSFSHELELERNSIQSKLLESIEHETKLNIINKQVEDEVRRLKSLIKSYEEQRDEEQASNSLIMSVADLKQLDHQQFSHDHGDIVTESTSDTSIKFELDKQLEKELNEKNRNLKQKLNEQEVELNKMVQTNQEIRGELEGNKKLISELRQDLACEKSLALKLTNQLTSFTKQIKHLDKQYFPIHDTSSTNDRKPNEVSNGNESKFSSNIFKQKEKESSLLNSVKSNLDNRWKEQKDDETLVSYEGCKKSTNEFQGNNNIECKNVDMSETRQQVDIENSSKLSAFSKESAKNYSQFDDDINSSKQSIIEAKGETENAAENGEIKSLLSISIERTEVRCSALASALTYKSTAPTLKNSDKDRDESCKGILLSTTADNNVSPKLAEQASETPLAAHDRSKSAKKTSSSQLAGHEDRFVAKRKHVHGSNNNSNSNGNINSKRGSNVQHITSISPISNACSLSSSPSAAITIGHDSGFQSINHDFNQISPPNEEAQKASSKSAVCGLTVTTEVATKKQIILQQSNRSTSITSQNVAASESTAANRRSATPTQLRDIVSSAIREANPVFGQLIDGSQKQKQQISTAQASAKSTPSYLSLSSSSAKSANLPIQSRSIDTTNLLINGSDNLNYDEAGVNDDEGDNTVEQKRAPTPVKSRSTSNTFVRNSLPSRSVNFGHSKSSAYLDRIRASVTATTTTNTSSSFNEQTQNILSSQPSRQSTDSRYVLNCMLDHQHSERCFVTNNFAHVQTSQVIASDRHNYPSSSPIQSSRQLNALIDPVSHERLMMSMLNQSHDNILQHPHPQQLSQAQAQRPIMPLDNAELTEQQIAHLSSLHHQHYYHHLQYMHQLHQMHHQHHMHLHHHRMHHKYQQQQVFGNNNRANKSAQQSQQDVDIINNQSTPNRQYEPIYSGGSQFYANMTANNSINQLNEHHHRTRLVNSNHQQHLETGALRSTPNRQTARISPHKVHQQLNNYTLPQIDEVNGLPSVVETNVNQRNSPSKQQQRNAQVVITSDATSNTNLHNSSSNGSSSSSSSSPTSSTSSNLSPSSASSSSSLNSLSTSSVPLNRSALRHTTTDYNRRQFSIERDLIEAVPMTATLSRVGSCRVNRSIDETQVICNRQLQNGTQMRTPVKSQQPPMRTSKILNISQQTGPQVPVQQQSPNELNTRKVTSIERDGIDKLAGNLASIRLNDSLAFTSLRAPKNSSGASGVNRSLTNSSNDGQTSVPSAKSPTSSSSPERMRQNNNATNGNVNNKSSVWFEYGCV